MELERELLITCCRRAVVPVKGDHAVAHFQWDLAMSVLSAPLFTWGYFLPPVFNIALKLFVSKMCISMVFGVFFS